MSALNEGVFQQSASPSSGKSPDFFAPAPSPAPPKQSIFSTSIIEEDSQSRGRRAAQTGLAFALQAAILGALLVIPLIFTEGMDLYKLNSTLLVAPPPPAAPPSAPPPMARAAAAPKPSFIKAQLTAPTLIPKRIVATAPDAGAMAPAISGVTGGIPGGVGDVLAGAIAGPPPPPPVAVAEKPKGPIRISSGMKEPRILYAPPVMYSPIARQAHVSGVVVLEAIIDEHGNVTGVKVISGPALLFPSAIKAVEGRKYEPTILDDQPVAIRLDIKVDFKLSS
ncbi:MAG: energy transducer TonB [Candidatus Acidiferrales bacterium]|jgi:protein TonB